jgi:hypothetical protein
MMNMETAVVLLRFLCEEVGPDQKGVGPDVKRLILLWGNNEPSDLGLAVNELERQGFIDVERHIAGTDAQRARYGLRGIVGVHVTEAMQAYCDTLELA